MTESGGVSGSFRDPGGFVFERDGRIFRVITRHSLDDWNAFAASELFRELERDRLLIGTRPADATSLPDALEPGAQLVEHERVPFVSYPYEWPFSMLKEAALLHLELLERALARGFVLKDATPYNVQFIGSRPVFIDVLSFARHREGEPWAGYNQFCKMLLYPLMLEAYKRIPFQSWLRSELEGLDPLTFSRLLGLRDRLRAGVMTHVQAHAWLQPMARSRPSPANARAASSACTSSRRRSRMKPTTAPALRSSPTPIATRGRRHRATTAPASWSPWRTGRARCTTCWCR